MGRAKGRGTTRARYSKGRSSFLRCRSAHGGRPWVTGQHRQEPSVTRPPRTTTPARQRSLSALVSVVSRLPGTPHLYGPCFRPRGRTRDSHYPPAGTWNFPRKGTREVVRRTFLLGSGLLNESISVVNLSAAGGAIGSGSIAAPQAWTSIALAQPLVAGDYVQVVSASTLGYSTYLVRHEALHSGHFLVDSSDLSAAQRGAHRWDVDDDAVDDFVVDVESLGRLYIGMRGAGGAVIASHCLLYPYATSGLVVSAPDRLYLESSDLDSPMAPHLREFRRIPSAPGAGLAHLIGDINADGLTGDALVCTVDMQTQATSLHYATEVPGGGLSWSTANVPASAGEIEGYSFDDFDGDGALDVIFNVVKDDESLLVAYSWSPNGFVMHAGR